MREITAPPGWILILLWPFKGEPCYPQIEGDLAEEFHQRESDYGLAPARRWYYREVLRNVWSLTWRWATLQAIILPVLCILFYAYSQQLPRPLVEALLKLLERAVLGFNSALAILILNSASLLLGFLFTGIVGLTLGMVCSLILRGHERMLRLAFGGYFLALIIVCIHVVSMVHIQKIFLLGYFCKFIWFPLSFSLGSMWIERRQRSARATKSLQ